MADDILIKFIKLYQRSVAPLLGANCRFFPSCSEYSIMAVKKYGALKGAWFSFRRIIRCQPLCCGGVDHP